jgi:hypothetical protein
MFPAAVRRTSPLPPQVQRSGLPVPISHLSWASDNIRLAVSTSAVQDNEGWGVNIVDTTIAHYYLLPGAGISAVPVTGSPDTQRSYYPRGHLPARWQPVRQPCLLRWRARAQYVAADVGGIDERWIPASGGAWLSDA